MPLILSSSVPAAGHCAHKLPANIARTASALGVLKFGSAATVAVLATGGVMATATAAGHPHAKVEATKLSIKNKAIAHGRHHADAITGVLSARRKGVAGETITLDGRTGKHPPVDGDRHRHHERQWLRHVHGCSYREVAVQAGLRGCLRLPEEPQQRHHAQGREEEVTTLI
jgi:hypothetical protein